MIQSEFRENAKVEISRFKGLGEMSPKQLKETAMDPKTRTMLRVVLKKHATNGKGAMLKLEKVEPAAHVDAETGENRKSCNRIECPFTDKRVEDLMGKKAEPRFRFIQENAHFATNLDI